MILFVMYMGFGFNYQLFSQSPLERYIIQLQAGHNANFPYHYFRSDFDADTSLSFLVGFQNDSSFEVRKAVYKACYYTAKSSEDLSVRRNAVHSLVNGIRDKEPALQDYVINYLYLLEDSDFSNATKGILIESISTRLPSKDKLIRILGMIGDMADVERLKSFNNEENLQSIRWSSLLAMSRIGDPAATEEIIQRLAKVEVNDDWIFRIMPDLVYTRNKEIISILVSALYSDENQCLPGDPDESNTVLCAFRILEELAVLVEDFPITVHASGDLNITDYQEGLQIARAWFSNNLDFELRK